MKRTAGAFLVAAVLGGCMSAGHRPWQATNGCGSCGSKSAAAPGVQGAWGQPIMMAPHGPQARGMPSGVVQASHMGGPGGGIMQASHHPAVGHGGHHGTVAVPPPPYGAVAAAGALQPGMPGHGPNRRTEIRFLGPDGMRVRWMNTGGPDGRPTPSPQSLSVPGRYNFVQGAIYQLKLEVPREDLPAVYPTLEIVPANARSGEFLAHSAVPVAFTNEDFDQVKAGNFVTKVIYLPDPQFQDLAVAGPEEIVSTRLEPGANPIAEAHRRGSILAVVRFGNIDLELQHSPPLSSTGAPGAGPMHSVNPTMPADVTGMPTTSRRAVPSGVQQVGHEVKQPATGDRAKTSTATPSKPATPARWWNFK